MICQASFFLRSNNVLIKERKKHLDRILEDCFSTKRIHLYSHFEDKLKLLNRMRPFPSRQASCVHTTF